MLQLFSLLGIRQNKGVEISRASNLELCHGVGLRGSLGLGGGGGCVRGFDGGLLDAGNYRMDRGVEKAKSDGDAVNDV